MMQPGHIRGALLALLATLWPIAGAAQIPGGAPGGNGFKVGDGRLHPFLDLETRLDSGVGYFLDPSTPDPNDVSDNLSGELVLRVRPGMRMEVPSSRMALNASAYLEYVRYTGLLTEQSTYASHLEGAADLTATFNPNAPVGLILSDQLLRTDQTRNVALGAGVLSLFNELRTSVPIKPGGGAFEVTPEASWAVEFFSPVGRSIPIGCIEEVCDPLQVDNFDSSTLRAGLDGRWRFLPKTAVVLDTDLDYRSYFHGTSPNALLLRVSAGLAGLVSPKISATAKLGWGHNFGTSGGNTLIAQLDGTYLFSPTMTFKAGYYRTLDPVAAYGLYRDDRLFAEARTLFGGKLTLRGLVSVDLLGFYDVEDPRSDTMLGLDLGADYQFKPWLLGAVGYLLSTRSSSLEGSGLNYTRNEGYLRLSLVY
ncbi:hypothetical protein [Stigmatella aurantiaca]|uniref:Conserved uncharacterized protein n=1 Tax=Stigmatella aurantiaca (strain DW4/3-1) TaxID=378806 RepID=Q095D7_STIAD|nr:hypothetical protein [Stigmatella aurantiaca]ADO70485.1 conserved uncharacterized protein [Stigmatella aurantiaca DW4/3-1]EAU67324.1 hypothetical protein STIAU_7044 [Stigmatella aurantiaca DW4/3-1]